MQVPFNYFALICLSLFEITHTLNGYLSTVNIFLTGVFITLDMLKYIFITVRGVLNALGVHTIIFSFANIVEITINLMKVVKFV